MVKNKRTELEFTRENVTKLLNDLIYEVANEGLPYDEDAKKLFNTEEFYEFNSEFRMYGTLFGVIYVEKLLKSIDNMALEKINKEDKEN